MDMSKAYRSAVEEFLPKVPIVFDKFHIMQLINQTIDKIRRKQQQKADEEGYKALKGNRYLILTNYDNLGPEE